MTWQEVNRRRRQPHFMLKIAGVPYRYIGGKGWPASENLEKLAIPYVDRKVIAEEGVEAYTFNLEVEKVRVRTSPLTVTMAPSKRDWRDAPDGCPAVEIGRLGYKSAGYLGYLEETLEQDNFGPAVIQLSDDTDFSALTFPRLMHIGQEAIYVNAYDHGLRQLQGITRGVINTPVLRHEVDASIGVRPWVTDVPVVWRGRRATLYEAAVRRGGGMGAWVARRRGYLLEPPAVTPPTVSVKIIPLDTLLDRKLSARREQLELVDTHHVFTRYLYKVQSTQVMPRRGIVNTQLSAAALGGTNLLTFDARQVASYTSATDFALPDGHPRRTQIELPDYGRAAQDYEPDASPAANQLRVVPNLRNAVAAQDIITSARDVEVRLAPLMDPAGADMQTVRWPSEALTWANTWWTPSTAQTPQGAWLDTWIVPGSRPMVLNVQPNIEKYYASEPMILYWQGGQRDYPVGDFSGYHWTANNTRATRLDGHRRIWYPFDFADPNDREPTNWERRIHFTPDHQDKEQYPIRGFCDGGFYQRGEEYLLVDRDVPMVSGEATLLVEYTDPVTGEEHKTTVVVTSSTEVFDPVDGFSVGYALELRRADRYEVPSFGNWPGKKRVRISQITRAQGVRPDQAILYLLHSSGGQGITDAVYDRWPIGCGLYPDEVDRESIRSISQIIGARFDVLSTEGKTLRDLVRGILYSSGRALGWVRDQQGNERVGLIRMGLEGKSEESGRVRYSASDGMPSSPTDNNIVNTVVAKIDFGGLIGETPKATLTYHDTFSQTAYGTEAEVELNLTGLRLPHFGPGDASLVTRQIVRTMFELFAHPRRTWQLELSGESVGDIAPGKVINITHPWLKGYGNGIGVSNVLARVIAGRVDILRGVAHVTLQHTGTNGLYWNAGCIVTAIVDPTTVEVGQNAALGGVGNSVHPVTGAELRDIDGFAVGDTPRLRTVATDVSAALSAITTVDRALNRLTFTAAHGAAVGDRILPELYAGGDGAYLADAAGTLGASNDPGHQVV